MALSYHHLLPHLQCTKTVRLTVKSQTPTEPSPEVPAKKPSSQGLGFGSSASSGSNSSVSSKQKKGGRASIIRRSPVEKPVLFSEVEEAKAKEMGSNESAFVVAWLGLGGVILVEGLALATSGFLPDEWDKLFVKYLYPSFTPTVLLFIAGTTAYGVIKYLQNEELKGQK
ncbi:PREDICTED: protein LOW PSII ACCUMULATION 2, chloroplastic [Fragaria vesca subsp. vesca]|uniref:protein LOW PSII ACCUMULATION 2, chloroplastic n=1 Tax=Fragaria vesca subsp. vesca TaxID=101020 RepID=UPI0002C2FC5A|nr:PREDICTED: protein LOW PSII ACCUMULATION 2, chloroplastic [Fragaria vesca subsp. vesca]